MPSNHILAVFLKLPEPGRVKTRLAAGIGAERAAQISADLTLLTLRRLPWDSLEVWICYDPPDRTGEIREWLSPHIPENARVCFKAQVAGDLGDRLRAVMDEAFGMPETASLTLIGTDCPDFLWPLFIVTKRMPQEGIDAVFGPALDGGYYMLALAKPCPELFSGIPWSTERTLEASLEAAAAAGRKVHVLERRLRDIDTMADFLQWKEHESQS